MLTSRSGILAQAVIYSGPFMLKILTCHVKILTYHDENFDLS